VTRSCAAFWVPPDPPPISPQAIEALEALSATLGDAGPRLQRADEAMRRVRPTTPNFYLQGLGTDPARQGEGLASAVLAPVLARCDADGVPSYLESTKQKNVPFYEGHGYSVVGVIEIPGDGPSLWSMWRDPVRT
jgi:GNAT superfamily N-acetyltransferase